MALTQELIDRFMGVDPATMGHYIGGGFMRPEMKPICRTSKMVGPGLHCPYAGQGFCMSLLCNEARTEGKCSGYRPHRRPDLCLRR